MPSFTSRLRRLCRRIARFLRLRGFASFRYSDQDNWLKVFPECGESSQSPVDIETFQVTSSSLRQKFVFVGYDSNINVAPLVLENTGHTVQLTHHLPLDQAPRITGGHLPGTYAFQSFHFHWGASDKRGSEHTINGKRYTMEAHIIHSNTKYANVPDAVKHEDGLVVLAIFFKANEFLDISSIRPITERLEEMREYKERVLLEGNISLNSLFTIIDSHEEYYTYKGSLTTPPCSEVVTWIVFRNYLPITRREVLLQTFVLERLKYVYFQMALFRSLQDERGKNLMDNYRKRQPQCGRVIQ